MIPMTLGEIAEATGGTLLSVGSPDALVTGVSIDSRAIEPGALYVPIHGERFDGHAFMEAAFQNGAACTLTEHPLEGRPQILVADTLTAMQALAAHYREKFTIPIIGITGSVGKPSTKEMLYAALSARFSVLKTVGSLNNQTGVPQTIFRLEKCHEAAIIEMGTNHFGEISALTRMVRPTVCLFTNIGVAHIEFFGSREGILKGKLEMLEGMVPGGTILVNGDDDLLSTVTDGISYGFSEKCRVRGMDLVENGLEGSDFTVLSGGERMRMHVPAPGKHTVMNALAAVAAGQTLGMTLSKLREGIASYTAPTGRMEICRRGKLTVLNDAYNANPDSMRSSLDVLSSVRSRRVCVLGDMFELGENAPAYHYETGVYAAEHADLVLCVGKDGRSIYEGAEERRPGCAKYYATQEELLSCLSELMCSEDTVLVKASHGMHLEQTVKAILTL